MTFRLGSIPVKISGSFLVLVVLIALQRRTLRETVALIVIIFISILVHELGHALVAKSYGADPSIEFWFLGGVTRWTIDEMTQKKRLAVTAAGSAFGFVLGGAVWLADQAFGLSEAGFSSEIRFAIFVNIFWGLLNWVPIRSLDGGVMTEILLSMAFPRRYGIIAETLFVGVAAAGLIWAFSTGQVFLAIIIAFFGLQGIGSTLERSRYGTDEEQRVLLDRAREAMAAGDCANPLRQTLVGSFESATFRTSAFEIMVLWSLRCGDVAAAEALISSPPERATVTSFARGALAFQLEKTAEAIRELTSAVFQEGRGHAVGLLLRAHARAGTYTEAKDAVLRIAPDQLPAADVLVTALRASDAGATGDAVAMAAHLADSTTVSMPAREAARFISEGASHLESALDVARVGEGGFEIALAAAVQPVALRAGLPRQSFELGERILSVVGRSGQHAVSALYNQACAMASMGRVEEGLDLLAESLALGRAEHQVEFVRDDPDLGALREHPRFGEVWAGVSTEG